MTQTHDAVPRRQWLRLDDKFLVGDGCWEWTGGSTGNGYGRIYWSGRLQLAHRVLYEILVSPIPEGLQLDHLCRNRKCVNPAHLEPVTGLENMRRGKSFAAVNARKTHCPHGHEYTEQNIYRAPKYPRRRECVACRRARDEARV